MVRWQGNGITVSGKPTAHDVPRRDLVFRESHEWLRISTGVPFVRICAISGSTHRIRTPLPLSPNQKPRPQRPGHASAVPPDLPLTKTPPLIKAPPLAKTPPFPKTLHGETARAKDAVERVFRLAGHWAGRRPPGIPPLIARLPPAFALPWLPPPRLFPPPKRNERPLTPPANTSFSSLIS